MLIKWMKYLTVVCLTCLLPSAVHAHALGQSHLFLKIYDHAIEGRVEITMNDLNLALGLDMPVEGEVNKEHLTPHIDQIHAYIADHLALSTDQTPIAIRYTDYDMLDLSFAKFAQFHFIIEDLPQISSMLEIDYTLLFEVDRNQTGLLVIEHNWYTGTFNNEREISLIFNPEQSIQTLDLTDSTRMNGFLSFIRLGNHHIAIGKDHILFIIALLLPAVMMRKEGQWSSVTHFRPALMQVIKIVTVFTLAHSISLSLAALDIVRLPGRLVESAIAVSIGIAALDIIFPIFGKRIWLVIFGFGLFHGFGFAEVLTDLGLGGVNLGIAMFGFNLGVELGQILILCLVFPVLYYLRRFSFYPAYILKSGSALLILAALYWSVERIFQVDIQISNHVKHIISLVLPS